MLIKQHYSATPDGSLTFAKAQLIGSKKAMDCMTVLCCANLFKDDKCLLLKIRKSKKLCCFKGVNVNKLPVVYGVNTNVWITGVLLEKGCASGRKKLMKKIVLFVDNYTAHLWLSYLRNIQLKFLPKNTTSLIQQMDQGVIRNFKHFYRKTLIWMILEEIEEGLLEKSLFAVTVSS